MGERPTSDFHSRSCNASGHLETALIRSVGGQFFWWEYAEFCQGGEQHDGVMTRREHKPVAIRRIEPVRIQAHFVKVKRGQDVRRAQSLPYITVALAARHQKHIAPDVVRAPEEF